MVTGTLRGGREHCGGMCRPGGSGLGHWGTSGHLGKQAQRGILEKKVWEWLGVEKV